MAYDHGMMQQRMDSNPVTGIGLALGAGADLGSFAPGLQPIEVRGLAIVVTVACTVTAPVIGLYKRPVAGAVGSAVLIKSLTALLAAFDTAGKVVYSFMDDTSLNDLVIRPGEDVFCEVITPPTAGSAFAVLMYQPQWDQPLNNTKMTASTT